MCFSALLWSRHFDAKGLLITPLTNPIYADITQDAGARESTGVPPVPPPYVEGDVDEEDVGSTADTVLQALNRRGTASRRADNSMQLQTYVKEHLATDEELVKTEPQKMHLNKLVGDGVWLGTCL